MNIRNFIFSNVTTIRWKRHFLFWVVYCTYFYIQSINPQTPEEFSDPGTYSNAFVSLYCFVPFCMLSVYVTAFYILPRFIEKRKYGLAIISFIIWYSFGTLINYFTASLYFSTTQVVPYGKGALSLGYLNTIWAMIISGFAMAIRITKNWYIQQKEISEITRIKARNELSLQKKRIHPGFLYSSLDSIHTSLEGDKNQSSSMILVLSNLLSYSLYESDTEKVSLKTELASVEDFISLEKMKESNRIFLHIDEHIDTSEIMVSPMVILSVLQDEVIRVSGSGCQVDIFINEVGDEILINVKFTGLNSSRILVNPSTTIRLPKNYQEYEPA